MGTMTFAERVAALQREAAEDGVTLPLPAAWIVYAEGYGWVCDLQTGQLSRAAGWVQAPTSAAWAAVAESEVQA